MILEIDCIIISSYCIYKFIVCLFFKLYVEKYNDKTIAFCFTPCIEL